jgi:hypothetical protein
LVAWIWDWEMSLLCWTLLLGRISEAALPLELAASIGPVFPIDGNFVYGCLTVFDCFVSLGSGGPDKEEGGCTSGASLRSGASRQSLRALEAALRMAKNVRQCCERKQRYAVL